MESFEHWVVLRQWQQQFGSLVYNDDQIFGCLVEQFMERLASKHEKNLYWFDHSGHAFHPIDTKEIEQLLINKLIYHHEPIKQLIENP